MWTPVLVAVCVLGAGGSSAQLLLESSETWAASSGRILGGEPVEDISLFPWHALVIHDGRPVCSGSIIARRWVLTAAHCIDYGWSLWYRIQVGTAKLNEGGTVYRVMKKYVHSGYVWSTPIYDIGLMKTWWRIYLGDEVQVVNLGTSELEAGTSVNVTGWGATETDPLASTLKYVEVEMQDRTLCNSTYNGLITEQMVCAGVEDGSKDACHGDSGGALVAGDTQYGIVSGKWWGDCGQPGYPTIYTSVPALRSWITHIAGV